MSNAQTKSSQVSDWSKNWHGSISMKITSIIVWVLMVFCFLFSIPFLKFLDDSISNQYHLDKVHLEEALISQLKDIQNPKDLVFTAKEFLNSIDLKKQYKSIHAIQVDFNNQTFFAGKKKDDQLIFKHSFQVANHLFNVTSYHIAKDYYLRVKKIQTGSIMVGFTVIFGGFLLMVVQMIIHAPFSFLVEATHAITAGNVNFRLDEKREDEFGEVSNCLNHMMDKLSHQQNQLVNVNKSLIGEIKEKDKARDEAIAANRSKSEFLANMSHEIRTPLNAILGYTHLIQRKNNIDPDITEAANIIEKSSDHLLMLINDILDLSKIEAGRMMLNLNDFDLAVLIKDLSDMFMIRCEEKGIDWQVILTPDDKHLPVKGDEGKLRQVLINLLGNALKFTSNGKITFKITRQQKLNYLFEVIDTGEGISEDAQKKIFISFHQEHVGLKTGGTGLGLAISSKQINFMGGELQVESEPGTGSRFFFSVNFEESVGEVIQDTSRFQFVKYLAPGFKITALVADDNEINRNVLQNLLNDIGIEVHLAIDGLDALEKTRQITPDIIFMDWRMPNLDGLEAMKKINMQYGDKIKNVMISASALDHEYETLLSSGASYVIKKPFKEEEIFYSLHKVLGAEFVFNEKLEEKKHDPIKYFDASTANVSLPAELLQNILQAATLYDISSLESYFNQIKLNPDNLDSLYLVLSQKLNKYDMEGIIDIINQLQENLHD